MTFEHLNSDVDFLPEAQAEEFLPPIENWVIFGSVIILLTIVSILPLSAVLKYKEVVRTQASVRPAGEIRIVQSALEGQVDRILVKENQTIEKGQVLATIDSGRLRIQEYALKDDIRQAEKLFVELKGQISGLDHQISSEQERIKQVVASAQEELKYRSREYRDIQITSNSDVESAEAELKSAQAALNVAKVKRDRYQRAAEQGAISKNQFEEAQLAVQQQEQLVASTRAKNLSAKASLNPSDARMAIANQQIAQEKAAGESALAELQQRRQELQQQQIEAQKSMDRNRSDLKQVEMNLKQTQIVATASGTLLRLNLRNSGQTVGVGEELAQVAPSHVPLELKAAVAPQDISKIEVGQAVSVRISACPYPDYGTLAGKVSLIGKDTVKPQRTENNAMLGTLTTPAAFYEVVIQPNQLVLKHGINTCAIAVGMEGRADIVSREETVLQFILRKARLTTDI